MEKKKGKRLLQALKEGEKGAFLILILKTKKKKAVDIFLVFWEGRGKKDAEGVFRSSPRHEPHQDGASKEKKKAPSQFPSWGGGVRHKRKKGEHSMTREQLAETKRGEKKKRKNRWKLYISQNARSRNKRFPSPIMPHAGAGPRKGGVGREGKGSADPVILGGKKGENAQKDRKCGKKEPHVKHTNMVRSARRRKEKAQGTRSAQQQSVGKKRKKVPRKAPRRKKQFPSTSRKGKGEVGTLK